MRMGDQQLDPPSLTPLSVASCGRLHLGVPNWVTSVDYCKQLIIGSKLCGSRFSTGRLLAIEDFTSYFYKNFRHTSCQKMNFVNHIIKMSIKVAKSIGLIYKLNRFFPETILKPLYTSFVHTYSYHMVQMHGMEHIKIIPLNLRSTEESHACKKIFLQTMNVPTHTSHVIKSFNFLIRIIRVKF